MNRLDLKARLDALGNTKLILYINLEDLTRTDAERLVNQMSELLGEVSRLVGVIEWKEETKE
jgi:hypothetical protein